MAQANGLLTIAAAAKKAKIPYGRLRTAVADGRLPTTTVGKREMVLETDLKKLAPAGVSKKGIARRSGGGRAGTVEERVAEVVLEARESARDLVSSTLMAAIQSAHAAGDREFGVALMRAYVDINEPEEAPEGQEEGNE